MNYLNTWIEKIKTNDPNQVAELYDKDALLLGTFSDKERHGHKLILEYFENLLQKKIDVEVISEHKHETDSLIVVSGFYNFILENKIINARFSFVFKKSENNWKILSHHSSIVPE
jgi:uncharacterized protein (TIGR02246 family)